MKLSVTEIQVMNHLSDVHPKPSSLKQLSNATGRNREELMATLDGLIVLTFLSVGTKKEVWLRKAGKEYLGIKPETSAKKTKADNPIADVKIVEKAIEKVGSITVEKSNKEDENSNALNHELDAVCLQLDSPAGKVKRKAEKVRILAVLSDRLKKTAPYVSQQLLDIAKLLHRLDEAA